MFKKYRPNKYISYLYFTLPIIFSLFINMSRESDIWFLLSIGRYIVGKGIPTIDILSMHSNYSFISQQWLSSVIYFLTYKYIGSIGLFLLMIIVNLLILYFLYKLCLIISNGKIFVSVIVSSFVDILLELTFIVPRPQIFTILLFIILLYILEYSHKNKSNLIYLIPIISLLLINLHGSMWLCLFIIILPYLVEDIYKYIKNKDKYIVKVLITIIISFICGFINPYGIKLMTYSLNSYGVSYINMVVLEMASFNLSGDSFIKVYSYLLLILFIIICTILIFNKKKKLQIHEYFLLFGTLFMALLNIRNYSLFYICGITIIAGFINIKDGNKLYKPRLLYGIIIVIIGVIFTYNFINNKYVLVNENSEIVKYLNKNTDKNILLYTSFNDGAYYEYYGYKPYIDSRAEVFFKVNNLVDDTFIEYYYLINGKIDGEEFLNKYNFSYLVVSNNEYLYNYLDNNSNYQLVLESNNRCLFKKISN